MLRAHAQAEPYKFPTYTANSQGERISAR